MTVAPGTTADGLRSRFEDLLSLWRGDTGLFSDHGRIFAHPAFAQIVALGDPAVPLILEEVHKGDVHLCGALRAITGADPSADADTSLGARDAWTRWGQGSWAARCGLRRAAASGRRPCHCR